MRMPEMRELAQTVMELNEKRSELRHLVDQLRFLGKTNRVMGAFVNEICDIYEWPELKIENRYL